MKKYRIAMVAACPFPANYGTPGGIKELSEALADRGHDIHVVTYHLKEDISMRGIKVHRIPEVSDPYKVTVGPTKLKPFLNVLLVMKLWQVIKKEGIEIIHAHNYEGALVGYMGKLFSRKPLVYNAVNAMGDELPSYGFIRPRIVAVKLADFLDRKVPGLADYIIPISEELLSFLVSKGVSRDKMTIVPLGINLEMFTRCDPQRIRSRLNLDSRPLIVYTGVVDEFQRIDYLLNAMTIVLKQVKDALLLMVINVKNPGQVSKYENMAKELGIDSHVMMVQGCALDEVPDYLAAADVTVIPRPDCPGFPLKLLNYMAAGKAIVTFHGSAKGLKNLHNGIIVEDHHWREMGEKLIEVLQNPQLASSLGEQARLSLQGKFDWPTIARQTEEIYAHILGNG